MSIDLMEENGLIIKKPGSRCYLARIITDADYANYLALLEITPGQAESLLPII